VGYLVEGLFWEAACTGVWLLTLSSVSTPELVTAVLAGIPCAVLAIVVRRAVGGSWSPRAAWTGWLLRLPVAVLADTVRVLGLAAGVLVGRRLPDGEIREVRLPVDRPASRWRARQAGVETLVSATPGTVVADVDQRSGRMLLHALGDGRPSMDEVVRR
jgi:multisubunit Na+/H+ antiporter MnhE subunit